MENLWHGVYVTKMSSMRRDINTIYYLQIAFAVLSPAK